MAEPRKSEALGDELVKQEIITREELDKAKAIEKSSGTPWYRQLLQRKKVSYGALDFLWHEYHPKEVRDEHHALGNTLLEMKAISKQQLDDALAEQTRNGRLLGNILLDRGVITSRTKALALSRQLHLEFAELEKTPSEPAALEAVPESVARKGPMLPVRLDGDKLTVLIADPQARAGLEKLRIILNRRIYPILTVSDDLRAEIVARYQHHRTGAAHSLFSRKKEVEEKPASKPKTEATPTKAVTKPSTKREERIEKMATKNTTEAAAPEKSRFEEIKKQAAGAPVVKLVSTLIEGAVNSGATDVHLDPQDPEMRARYRIDGVLHDVMSIPREIETAVVSRVKIMADLDITETRHPQDGHISMNVGDMEFDIRVATLPTYLGERVVLRLLDQSSVLAGIKDLGLESEDEQKLSRLVSQPYGMILVTGPTGSGKTTTLYAALNQKDVMTESIVTLEDPVEYQLSGINQVQIDTDINLTFATTLRAALRQDIDVLLVGEIRDAETARIAIRAAMTGHLVFSTLHTNDAPEAITTLLNMGVPSYLIASALTAVVGQRLVRKICPKCKTTYVPPKALMKSIGLGDGVKKLAKGEGCEYCYHTGTKGRTGIFELIEITPEIRKLIASDSSVESVVKVAKLKTMADRCRQKVKDGIVPAEEFLRVIRT
ncbi:MAG: Flp pilus assembly complex ATPase component TadA [Candidatus Hydrogenedentes bacterium]|nr:Flp pilus assembly complex ATPase component TadA [Candidatus Hydrogenedentota bacterium]